MIEVAQTSLNEISSSLYLWKKFNDLDSSSSLLASWSRRLNVASPCWQKMPSSIFVLILAFIFGLWIIPVSAAFVEFQNCLSERTLYDQPLALQLVPQFVNVIFNNTSPGHKLNVTVWVNVTGSTAGSAPRSILPPTNDTSYWSSNNTGSGGKVEAIPNPDTINKETSLYNNVYFLNYQQFSKYSSFCENVKNGACPLSPVWTSHQNASSVNVPEDFPHFGFDYNPYSTYALASLATSLKVKYGNQEASEIGCISVNITPEIGSILARVVKFAPLVVLMSVGFSILFAAIWSPWGSYDIFLWSTNYGRDPNLLRIVTPGFGDCLQYIQFVVLTAGLKIDYPGFYQPIISKLAWSTLTFNYRFFQNPTSSESLVDGIYVTNGIFGLEKLSHLIGITQIENLWNSMAISLLALIATSLMTIQVGLFIRWTNRKLNDTYEEDLGGKNVPFSVGNIIRIIFNYFLLPLVTLSMFQLAIASKSPMHTVGLAVLLLFFIVGLAIWFLNFIVSIREKSFLFDDFRTVLLFGSLYCTYSDHAVSFAAIPIALNFVRGVAVGAVQVSGIAQIVLLAACEVITILTIHGFRPFMPYTSMNAYHISFSAIRLATLLLMISFASSFGVTEGSKGWVGYAILLMHSFVLILGFLLNAMQTIVGVGTRLVSAGEEGGQARDGLADAFCMRTLSRRLPQYDPTSRQSQLSNVAMLDSGQRNSHSGRIRSQSAGSTGVLTGRQSLMADRSNSDKFGAHQQESRPNTLSRLAGIEAYAFSNLQSASTPSRGGQTLAPLIGSDTSSQADPYYRPPRHRKLASENISTAAKSQGSWNCEKWMTEDSHEDPIDQASETPLKSRESSLQLHSVKLDKNLSEMKADYTTREVDFYYRISSSAPKANIQNRRVRTTPTESSVSTASATSWFNWITSRKTKEKGKGFEVIRGSRLPPTAHSSIGL